MSASGFDPKANLAAGRPAWQGAPGTGVIPKLPPFEVKKETGKRDHRTHKRAADGNTWTRTELVRRNAALRQTLGMESTAYSSEAYRNSPLWCPECNGRRACAPGLGKCLTCAGIEESRAGRSVANYELGDGQKR